MAAIGPRTGAALALAAIVLLGGCQRSVSGLDTRGVAAPLPASPVSPVESASLDPAAPAQLPAPASPDAFDPNAIPDPALQDQVASLEQPAEPPAATAPITREGVSGQWNVNSDNPECRVILPFTKWSGGYRAATRRCDAPELAAVSAWDVKDNKVVLFDAGGNQLATLYSVGPERYEGATAGGKKVTFSR